MNPTGPTSLDALVGALDAALVLVGVDLLPRLVQRLVGRRVACRERVRVLGEEDEDGGDRAVDDRHDDVGDRVADEEPADTERGLGVGHASRPRVVAVGGAAPAGSRAEEAHDDLAEQQHVGNERIVHDGAPALRREQLEHALSGADEAVAVDADVRVRKAVKVLDPLLDAPDQASDAAHEAGGDRVSLALERFLPARQDEANGLDDRNDQ